MSLFANAVIRKSLEENKAYPAILVSVTEKEATQNDEGILGFVTFNWQLEDGRIISDTCRVTADTATVPSGLKIRLSELADQLPPTSKLINTEAETFVHAIIDRKMKFNLWVERRDTEDKFYTNYHFRAPRVKTPQAPAERPKLA